MQKNILITGASDGLGFATAVMLLGKKHNVIIHSRTEEKLHKTIEKLQEKTGASNIKGYVGDLSVIDSVKNIAQQIIADNPKIDVLINNAGVFITSNNKTSDGLDVRFAVNTIAPYILIRDLLPMLSDKARVINLSSAAQTSVDINALLGNITISENSGYAMSKLALIIVTKYFADKYKDTNKVFIAVNPKSFLGTKMVQEAYGMQGADVNLGAEIITRLALEDSFARANGEYYDNDIRSFSSPHPEANNPVKSSQVIQAIKTILKE